MKLIIMPTTQPRLTFLEHKVPFELTVGMFASRSEEVLETYGGIWARLWKTDIVMLVD